MRPSPAASRTVRGPSGVASVTDAAAAVRVERHRRQLRHAVRAQRAPEVDGLAAGAAQLEQGDARRHPAAMRATPASVAAAPASWCGAMRSRSTPKASSTVTTGYREPSTATRLR